MRRLLAVLAVLVCAGCTTTHASPHAAGAAAPHATGAGKGSTSAPQRPAHLGVHALSWRLPGPLAREAVARLAGGRVLVAGGLLPGDASSAATFTLDLATGSVHRGPALPVAVHDTAGAVLDGRVLVIGGGNAAEQAVVQARGLHGWRVVGRLPNTRSDLAAVTVGGRVVVLGGYDGTSPALGDVLVSRDGRHWSRLGGLPRPVRYPGVAFARGAIWVFGGERNGAEVTAVQRMDPATGRADVVTHLPRPLGHEAAVVLGDRILVAGGRTGPDTLTPRMWWFSPTTRRFTPAGRLPRPLADTAAVQGRDRAWLVGGETPAFSRRVWQLLLGR